MYRTAQYLLANFSPFAENSTIKPCLLFAMQLDGLDACRARFGREATRTVGIIHKLPPKDWFKAQIAH